MQFNPDSIWTVWNDATFEDGRPNNKNNNKMSSDMRSVPGLKITTKANKRIFKTL